ncbi:MAG TPA: hypothetical protein VLB44_25570 [Kofleriaceae bacterium]|nr:hypothetical protein [Kofleriaceae bacterium]
MRRVLWVVLVAGCGSDPELRMSASMTVADGAGSGTSPLDGLIGQTVAFEIDFLSPGTAFEMVDTCHRTSYSTEMPASTSSGATASIVQTEILEHLPAWNARLELCDPASLSSVTLMADNEAGLAVTVGCRDIPLSAQHRDGNGNPAWSTFSSTTCDGQIYDQLHARLFTGAAVTLHVSF